MASEKEEVAKFMGCFPYEQSQDSIKGYCNGHGMIESFRTVAAQADCPKVNEEVGYAQQISTKPGTLPYLANFIPLSWGVK